MATQTQTAIIVAEYLKSLKIDDEAKKAQLDEAVGLIESALDVDLQDVKTFSELSYYPVALPDLISAGAAKLGAKPVGEVLSSVVGTEKYESFVEVVTAKGYFAGAEEGTVDYKQRQAKLAAKVLEKIAAAGPPKEELEAEEKKNLGNAAIAQKDYNGAIQLYTEAIQLSPTGPNSHVYYSNRAAAYCHLKKFDKAVSDCEDAIQLQPDYVKAHTRLCQCLYFDKKWEECIDAAEKALVLEPDNKSNLDLLAKAKAELNKANGVGMPGRGGGGGMPGGLPPNLAGLMNNPMMQQAMSQMGGAEGLANMMKDPAMMQMAQEMMKNPAAMQQAMAMLGGGGGGMPDLSALGLGGAPSSSSKKKGPFKGFEE